MAENVIDTLSLEIESNVHGADESIERLAKSLQKLKLRVGKLSDIDLTKFSENMRNLINSTKGFDGESLSSGINALQKLSKLKLDNIPNTTNTANSIKGIAEVLKDMSGITIPDLQDAPNLVTAIKQLGAIGKIDLKSDTITASAIGIMDMAQALKDMSGITIPNLNGVDGLIGNLRKLGKANISQVGDNLPKIEPLVHFVEELNRIQGLSFDFSGVATLVQNISRLSGKKAIEASENFPELSKNLLSFFNELNKIKSIDFDISGLTALVSAITKLGSSAASKAIPNIDNLADSLKKMMNNLSKAPNVSQNLIQMTTAMAQLASNGGRVSNMSTQVAAGFGRITPSASNARKSSMNLAVAFGKLYTTFWLVLQGLGKFKKAIDISSDLTEVQNVVDVTFGDMKQKVEDLAATSIQDFGMSELTAKQISSRFQAMGLAMGFTQDKMSDMSIELTKLAADMASFYNVEQDVVAKSLQSVFTGETEPLMLAA